MPRPIRATTVIATNNTSEQDYQLNIINSLLVSTHRDLEKVRKDHKDILERDPMFYGKLAGWYLKHGELRDTFEVFISNLLVSEIPEHREAGFMFLQRLPVHQVLRLVNFMRNNMKKFPRQARTAVVTYLKTLTFDELDFYYSALRNKKALKNLYVSLRLRMPKIVKDTIYDNNPAEDSLPWVLKKIAKEQDTNAQAELVALHKIPFPIAIGAIKKITPATLVALISNMSGQEVVNNLGLIKRHGGFDNPETKKLVEDRLAKAKTGKGVSATKAIVARDNVNLDEDIVKAVEKVADTKIRSKGTIRRSTALFIDISGSMEPAIEIAKTAGAVIGGALEKNTPFYIYTFNTIPTKITPKEFSLSGMSDALKYSKASGSTYMGAPLRAMTNARESVEQIVIITDEGENGSPNFAVTYEDYAKALGIRPEVIIIRLGAGDNKFQRSIASHDIKPDIIQVTGSDYTSLPNLVPLLSRGSRMDLLVEVMATELPRRPKSLDELIEGRRK